MEYISSDEDKSTHEERFSNEEKEEPLYNPYNPLNVEITLNDVQCILSKYGLPPMVNNMTLYRRAFIHNSYTMNTNMNINIAQQPDNCLPLSTKSNERLEFLGDAIINYIIIE